MRCRVMALLSHQMHEERQVGWVLWKHITAFRKGKASERRESQGCCRRETKPTGIPREETVKRVTKP